MDAIAEFFADLNEGGVQARLQRATGRLRFEVFDDGHAESWLVAMDKGNVSATRADGEAPVTLRGDKRVFEEILSGRSNMMAAILRGAVTFEGSPAPLGPFLRLLPGPATSSHPRAAATLPGRPS